jgi:hypothetical protein
MTNLERRLKKLEALKNRLQQIGVALAEEVV